jgi:tRNA A-37 threonylcarbamoyl transferase component Bud32
VSGALPGFDAVALRAAGRDLPARFTVSLSWLTAPPGMPAGSVDLECESVLRLLPGRRLVARVRLDGAAAVLKLFFGPDAVRYCERERRGCALLCEAGVTTPALLGSVTGAGGRGLVFDYLAAAEPLCADDQAGVEAAAAELARLHARGCRHTDLHLDNFLTAPGAPRPSLIDGDGVRRVRRGELGFARSLADLAVLGAQRPPRLDPGLDGVWRAYAAVRGWPAGPTETRRLNAAVRGQRRARLRRYLAKAQRDCSEFRCRRDWHCYLVAVRGAWDVDLAALLGDPEAAMDCATVLKAGNSATVVRAPLGSSTCVIKRYNLKGPWHALRRNLRPLTRFRAAWCNGQRLHMLGIPTARPLALLERRWGPWRGVAYLVMEDLAGAPGGTLDLAAEVEAAGLQEARLAEVVQIFRDLETAELVHGDTKATNFLLAADGLHLVDLDALAGGGARGRQRDRRRFLDNFRHLPEVHRRIEAAFADAGLPVARAS